MTKVLDQNDTFNALKYKRFGIHPDYETEDPYTYWVNDEGQIHRENGPATEWDDGTKAWWLNGNLHREDGPAIEYADGAKMWFINGNLHREDGPAVELPDGAKQWWLNGKIIRSE